MGNEGNAPSDGRWLTTATFAAEHGISARAARKALARAFEGRPWRGKSPVVRKVPSRGGAAGWAFEVLAESVNGDADVNSSAVPPAPGPSAPLPLPNGPVAARRHAIIGPALRQPPGSSERKRAVTEAARQAGVSERTIYEWLAAHEAGGVAALQRRPREDRGRRKHTVSAAWDSWAEEARLDDTTKARIAARLERHVRSLWAAATEVGARRIALLASDKLAELTEEAGFGGDSRRLKKICKLSLRFVRRNSQYRAVAIHDQDAKQWHDKHRPRIRRTREGRLPMQVVVCDVHPMDVLLPRPDGSTFTAKLIAFQDWATNRIFVHAVFPPKGEGVRQEHIVEAIIAMTQDPRWGVPQVLYLDNGSEYGCVDLVADALRLTTQVRALGDDPAFNEALRDRCHPIVRAQPYNAAAKAIEPSFKVLERGFFSLLLGWIGGDRMAKRTANVGRAPVPYRNGKEALRADLQKCLAAYHATPQTGALNGRSPDEAYDAAIDAGWQRMDISRGALLAAFGRDESRVVHQGAFRYGGQAYTHEAIQELPAGTRLHLRVPICGGLDEIPVMDESGGLRCMAAVDRPFDVLDTEGAREAGHRLATARAGVAKLRADTDPVDVLGAEVARAAREKPAAIPGSAGVIRLSAGMEAIGRALERAPVEHLPPEDEDEEISRERARQLRARFLRNARATG